jgi:hypothetical protein
MPLSDEYAAALQEYRVFIDNMRTDNAAKFASRAAGSVKAGFRKMQTGAKFLAPLGVFVYGEVLGSFNTPELADYRRCRLFSVAAPAGESADVHLSVVLARLSDANFDKFRTHSWPNSALELGGMLRSMAQDQQKQTVLH